MKKITATIFVLLLVTTQVPIALNAQKPGNALNAFKYTIQKQNSFTKGAVVSAHPLASEVGLLILKKGGNAIDAAIATQWALAVVYPGAGNIGGGGFMVARLANGKTLSLDYREMAPGKASRDMYIDEGSGKANTRLSQLGHLAAGVPGTPAGLFASHSHAKLPMKTLIEPAIVLAEKGFALTEEEARSLNGNKASFERWNTSLPAFIRKNGLAWKAGDTLIQKDLAGTLRLIRDKGLAGFYEGITAKKIVNEMERGAGLISLEDLKNYRAKYREPIAFKYQDYHIITMPPPSSGGVLLQQMLGMLSMQPIHKYGFNSPEAVQLITEVERRAYADRAEHLGDPDFYKVPVKTITSEAYLKTRMADYQPGLATPSNKVNAGAAKESEETTHLSIMDEYGNAVAVTTTLNGGYGSKTVVSGAGFLLNNEMDDFSIAPGVPNMYGALGGKANEVEPGKRMLSSMTPTIVLKNNKPFMVVGTPGGTTIITSVLQTILNIVHFNMSAADAVNKPKFHHQWLPDQIDVEADFPEATIKALQAMGYTVIKRGPIGRTELILIDAKGKLHAVADKRGDDSVAGWWLVDSG